MTSVIIINCKLIRYKAIMKTIIIILFISLFSIASHAQVMQAKATWITISVPQLKCWECQQRLDNYLKREKGPTGDGGIDRWTMNLRAGSIKFLYYPDRIDSNYLKTVLANAGFDAGGVTAEPDSYKRLPPVCKKKEDGGGPVKWCNLEPADRPKE